MLSVADGVAELLLTNEQTLASSPSLVATNAHGGIGIPRLSLG